MTSQKGFTLIETVVYLGLFTIVVGGLIMTGYSFFESSDRNQTKAMLQEEQDFLISKIDWALDGAKTVSVPIANASAGTLVVTKYDGTVTTIGTQTGSMYFNTTGNILNNSNVTISNLVFIHTTTAGINAPESLEAGFDITTKTPTGSSITQHASTTRYVHK